MSDSKSYGEHYRDAVIASAVKHVDAAATTEGRLADHRMFGCTVIDIMRGYFTNEAGYSWTELVPARLAMAQSLLSNAQEALAMDPNGGAESARQTMNVAKWLMGAEAQVLLEDGLARDIWSPEFFGLE